MLASTAGGLAPGADYGPWRKEIGLTERVGPIVLRLFGETEGGACEKQVYRWRVENSRMALSW